MRIVSPSIISVIKTPDEIVMEMQTGSELHFLLQLFIQVTKGSELPLSYNGKVK
jgi:hypothetical protein